ncbi:response regulator [Pontibacter sp. G13]|uniref:response regulator transcription factor n=1 Tax=Pontibacter sp. G13 TaxID=3074898 RepID=UPI00288A9D60|nr:response regulator [Pontibacter sp. G13]WNJ18058.1 response regulator [Pontibacter sp. G13]
MDRPEASQFKVLIVDDEPHIRVAIEFLMQQQGFQTASVADGVEALEILGTFVPDAIVLDVMMPNMGGFEVAHEIRKLPEFSETRILFLTAKGADQDKREGYGAGGDLYLTKPFENRHLVESVKEMVGIYE